MHSTNHQLPHLVPKLRLALVTLYSLPDPLSQGGQGHHSSFQAHEYLLQFQSRNPRRNLHSKLSNRKNQHQQQQQTTSNYTDVGSTWLACVALVSSLSISSIHNPDPSIREVHYAEALFAAQTLVHRLRRVKLAEAIDVEFEPTVVDSSSIISSPPRPEEVLDGYRRWTLQYYCGASNLSSFGILSRLIHSYRPTIDPEQNHNLNELEERIKGEISMMVIVGIMDALIKSSFNHSQQQAKASMCAQIRPLMKTLASVLALIAVRMRYVSTSLPSPASYTESIVATILGAISMLQPQIHQHQQDPHQFQESVQSISFTCLTALPEAVLTGSNNSGNGGGGAYGRF